MRKVCKKEVEKRSKKVKKLDFTRETLIPYEKLCTEGSFGVYGRPDSNPGRPREPVKFHVAMSRCTN